MYNLLHGNVLMVGEGGFSFSVALLEKLSPSLYPNITATSLETDQSIKKHALVERNIAHLRDKGVTVELGVDATQLHTHPVFSEQKFDCVVFNFPHAGGKSNHKKNRKLLDDFFSSAAQVLKPHGQVIVTLCKGQGGTPADRPMREWHDSWQVVSMAANSGLILTQALPFNQEDYGQYTSTGFRSLDKGFHTENAVTHVFENAVRAIPPVSVSDVTVDVNGSLALCPRYLYNKLETIRSICKTRRHPMHTVFKLLETTLKQEMNIKADVLAMPTMWHPIVKKVSATTTETQYFLQPCNKEGFNAGGDAQCSRTMRNDSSQKQGLSEDCCRYEDASIIEACFRQGAVELTQEISNNACNSRDSSGSGMETCFDDLTIEDVGHRPRQSTDQNGYNGYNLISHPLEVVDSQNVCDCQPGDIVCEYGPVFQRKQINVSELPAEFFMKISLIFCQDKGNSRNMASIGEECLAVEAKGLKNRDNTKLEDNGCRGKCPDSDSEGEIDKVERDTDNSDTRTTTDNLAEAMKGLTGNNMAAQSEQTTTSDCGAYVAKELIEHLENCLKSILNLAKTGLTVVHTFTSREGDSIESDTTNVESVASLSFKSLPELAEEKVDKGSFVDESEFGSIFMKVDKRKQQVVVCCLNLSKIICAMCQIQDQRLLWSFDHRILDQFEPLYDRLSSIYEIVTSMKSSPTSISFTCYSDKTNEKQNVELLKEFSGAYILGDTDRNIKCIEQSRLNIDVSGTEPRTIQQTKSKLCLVPFSLYPLTFSHDMSFWESSEQTFDELTYFDIIRSVADDNVMSVVLIDTFTEPVNARTSRCYRLVFQSIDCALSYKSSWQLQSLIRLEVQKHMGIVLR